MGYYFSLDGRAHFILQSIMKKTMKFLSVFLLSFCLLIICSSQTKAVEINMIDVSQFPSTVRMIDALYMGENIQIMNNNGENLTKEFIDMFEKEYQDNEIELIISYLKTHKLIYFRLFRKDQNN